MYFKHVIGKQGEKIAEQYLKDINYKILEKNFFCKIGEIDIIALNNKQIVFIEIKTRTNTNYGLPAESVTERKLRSLYKAAEYYLYTRNLENEEVRIDVIEIFMKNKEYKINHLKQVI